MSPRNITRVRRYGLAALATAAAMVIAAGPASATASITPNSTPPSSARSTGPAASVANQTLTVIGTDGPDQVTLTPGDPNLLQVKFGSGFERRFDRATFTTIFVSLGGGDDQFSVAAPNFNDKALTVDGGDGNDTIVGSDGNDLLFGGNGNDALRGGKGADTAFLGSGQDTFQWDPGDGSDVVDGGRGFDTLIFNGSSGNEKMSLSPNGSRSVFLRDVGNIRMDMDHVEGLDLRALGGADDVTINDMRGTGFRTARVDLGGPDKSADTLTVNGTEHRDHVRVNADRGSVSVAGLRTETQITGSEPADQLRVNTLGGNDRVDVDRNVSTLIGVAVDLGPGQHSHH